MNQTGVMRRLDQLGRVVIPKEQRNQLGWEEGTPIEFLYDAKEGVIGLKEYKITCNLCGRKEHLIKFKDKRVCSLCVAELSLT